MGPPVQDFYSQITRDLVLILGNYPSLRHCDSASTATLHHPNILSLLFLKTLTGVHTSTPESLASVRLPYISLQLKATGKPHYTEGILAQTAG